jgi:hypothetical protein
LSHAAIGEILNCREAVVGQEILKLARDRGYLLRIYDEERVQQDGFDIEEIAT